MLKRLFLPKEVKDWLEVLDEAGRRFNCLGFLWVRDRAERVLRTDPATVQRKIQDGLSPRRLVYVLVGDIAGDLAQSGKYHVYRGVLNPMGGTDLLEIYDGALDEVVSMGAYEPEWAERPKAALRRNVADVG